jgi:hypothetical protein
MLSRVVAVLLEALREMRAVRGKPPREPEPLVSTLHSEESYWSLVAERLSWGARARGAKELASGATEPLMLQALLLLKLPGPPEVATQELKEAEPEPVRVRRVEAGTEELPKETSREAAPLAMLQLEVEL